MNHPQIKEAVHTGDGGLTLTIATTKGDLVVTVSQDGSEVYHIYDVDRLAEIGVLINGSPTTIPNEILPYEGLVTLAGLSGTPSATYKCRRSGQSGILVPEESVQPRAGMVFNVMHTGNA